MSELGGIEKIFNHILETSVEDTGDSGDGGCCPYCRRDCSWQAVLSGIQHDSDCIYIIAQELSKLL